MINVEEHVYHDDPAVGPPDVKTELRDVRYYFIGNGRLEAAIQHAPAGEGSLYGLLLMDAEQLKMKREALTFDPETGIAKTMLDILVEGTASPLERDNLTVEWDDRQPLPCVRVDWSTRQLAVSERYYCADFSCAHIVREISLRNFSSAPVSCTITTGMQSRSISRSIDLCPGGKVDLWILYSLDEGAAEAGFAFADLPPSPAESEQFWSSGTQVHLGLRPLHHLFKTATRQLTAMISCKGRIDASIWQYRREWVRDQAFMAHAVLLAGHPRLARVILERLLCDFVSDSGSTVDSSEVRAPADAELDQNGTLLHVLHEYALWTGDLSLVESHWKRIARTAEFPLQQIFREPASGLMFNQRDYWERHSIYGIEPGIELAYQVFVAIGLMAASGLARQVGRLREAERWQAEARRIREAVLRHPTHSLAGNKGFLKRRGIDGAVQEFIVPQPDAGLPREVGLARNIPHPLNPDSSCALPVVYGFVSPESEIAKNTMAQLEALWNQGWQFGGYGRYHMDSDPDSPGPWPFPSLYIARAYIECRDYRKALRVIDWLASLPQYPSGSFFEMYGHRIAPPYAQNGIVPWNWAEIIMLVTKNVLGLQPEENAIRIRPRLLPGMNYVKGSIPYRRRRIHFEFERDSRIVAPRYEVESHPFEILAEGVRIPFSDTDIRVEGKIPLLEDVP
jgi:hypothetical protein